MLWVSRHDERLSSVLAGPWPPALAAEGWETPDQSRPQHIRAAASNERATGPSRVETVFQCL